MRLFMRITAAAVTLLVLIFLPISLFAFQVGNILFSPQAMLNLVAVHVIGPSQSNLITETFLRSLPVELGIADDSIVGLAFLEAAERTDIHGSFIPSDLQLIYAAQGINAFFEWLEGPNAMPQLRLDMDPLKAHLRNNTVGIVQVVLQEVPFCSTSESLSLATELLGALMGGEAIFEELPPCLPEIIPMETIVPAIGGLLQQQITLIPQTITLENLITASPQSMLILKERLQLIKGFLQWSWLPFAFLLLIASLLGGQTRDGVPRWLGWSLILVGLTTLLTGLIPVNFWLALTAPQIPDWSPLFRVPALFILEAVYGDAQLGLIWFSLAMVILGGVMLLIAMIIKRRQTKTAQGSIGKGS